MFCHTGDLVSQIAFRLVYGNHVEQTGGGLRQVDWKSFKLHWGPATDPLPLRFAIWTKPLSFRCLLKSNAVVVKLSKVS